MMHLLESHNIALLATRSGRLELVGGGRRSRTNDVLGKAGFEVWVLTKGGLVSVHLTADCTVPDSITPISFGKAC